MHIAVILRRNPHSGLGQSYIGSDGTNDTASRLSLVEETEVPGENHRQQWVKTKNTTAIAGDRTATSGLTVPDVDHWTTLRPSV